MLAGFPLCQAQTANHARTKPTQSGTGGTGLRACQCNTNARITAFAEQAPRGRAKRPHRIPIINDQPSM